MYPGTGDTPLYTRAHQCYTSECMWLTPTLMIIPSLSSASDSLTINRRQPAPSTLSRRSQEASPPDQVQTQQWTNFQHNVVCKWGGRFDCRHTDLSANYQSEARPVARLQVILLLIIITAVSYRFWKRNNMPWLSVMIGQVNMCNLPTVTDYM